MPVYEILNPGFMAGVFTFIAFLNAIFLFVQLF